MAGREPGHGRGRMLAPAAMIAAAILLAWLTYWVAGESVMSVIRRMQQEPRSEAGASACQPHTTLAAVGQANLEFPIGNIGPQGGKPSVHTSDRRSLTGASLAAVTSGCPGEESRLKAGCSQDWLPHKRRINNPPQVGNLPHKARGCVNAARMGPEGSGLVCPAWAGGSACPTLVLTLVAHA
jgi:hypothetical protein